MRGLTANEVGRLEAQGCWADNWSLITVGDNFDVSQLRNVTFETGEQASDVVPILNEAGEGNVLLSSRLTSQIVALMLKYEKDKEFQEHLFALVADGHEGIYIGENVRITNSVISNSVICDSVIGPNVILRGCYVGERSQVVDGFTAYNSIITCNSHLSCGEACSVFCGPFTVSHHKSSLLIGGSYSFFNAGSATNFSNHAYKLGPIHYGLFERGVKTASGCHILLPANIGQFSVCFGKIETHPNTVEFPFSYIIGNGKRTWLVPGRNICSIGFYRDINKWNARDAREEKLSVIDFQWLSPFAIQSIRKAKARLEEILLGEPDEEDVYQFEDYAIKASSLNKGIACYDLALRLIGESPEADEEWSDLGGLLLPLSEEERIVEEIKSGTIADYEELLDRFETLRAPQTPAYSEEATAEWHEALRRDANREYALGDVDYEIIKKLCL